MENWSRKSVSHWRICQVSAGSQVGAPLSDKLYYAQFAGMDDAQIEAVVARAKVGISAR